MDISQQNVLFQKLAIKTFRPRRKKKKKSITFNGICFRSETVLITAWKEGESVPCTKGVIRVWVYLQPEPPE